jgi:hypothetical protein
MLGNWEGQTLLFVNSFVFCFPFVCLSLGPKGKTNTNPPQNLKSFEKTTFGTIVKEGDRWKEMRPNIYWKTVLWAVSFNPLNVKWIKTVPGKFMDPLAPVQISLFLLDVSRLPHFCTGYMEKGFIW